jgi:hypothetical protein
MKILFKVQPYVKPALAHYQHSILVIAEGLKELGIEFYGNIDYWYDLEDQEYVIQKAPEDFQADVELYSCWYVIRNKETFEKEINSNAINVLLDAQDGWDTPTLWKEFDAFDLILKCHAIKPFREFKHKMPWATDNYAKYPEKTRPWNYALSNRLIRYVDKYRHLEPKDEVLVNFRMPHDVRSMAVNRMPHIIEPKYKIKNNITDPLSLMDTDDRMSYWGQTGRRHNEEYYQDINSCKYTFAFGGKLLNFPMKEDLASRVDLMRKRVAAKMANKFKLAPMENRYKALIQYGGWRLFESFISNTVPVQMDFEYWNLDWPEMPVDGEHYISVKGLRFEDAAHKLVSQTEEERQIMSDKGREWCLKHYSPKPVAQRFLEHIKALK